MSFNAIKYYVLFYINHSRIMAHYCHVIYVCYQNMPQNLFASYNAVVQETGGYS